MLCKQCKYDLRGAASGSRCPECGTRVASSEQLDGPPYPLLRVALLAGIILTVITAVPAVLSSGAGHGDYFWAIVLFPYAVLGMGPIGAAALPFALVQFPLYGVIIAVMPSRRSQCIALAAVLLCHATVAAILLVW